MDIDLYRTLDAAEIATLVRGGELAAGDVLEMAIALAEIWNPCINAICHWQLEFARRAASIQDRSHPFAGVPFLLKDITTHAAGWPLTGGSMLFQDFVSTFDSTIVKRYLAAGLVSFGRTATPEFGYAATTESRLFGATRNPWNFALSAGGSSGGAAAAVAAGIVPMAQGGDSGGSLRIPAGFCGLFGMKPTRGRTPSGPVHGTFLGFSVTHAITRSVRDSAALLDVTHGPDTGAPYFAERPHRSFSEALDDPSPRLRIAVQRRAYDDAPVDSECLRAVDSAAEICRDLGHEAVDVDFRFDPEKLRGLYCVIWPTLVRLALDQRTKATGRQWRLEDLETYVARIVDGAMHVSGVQFAEALERVHAVGREFVEQSDSYDAVLSPTTALMTPRIGVLDPSNPDQSELDEALRRAVAFTQIYNATGQPAASLPVHRTKQGMPVGVQFATRYGDDAGLLRLARSIERARPWQGVVPLGQDHKPKRECSLE